MRSIGRRIRKNKVEFWLILIGYIIGIFSVPLGISLTNNAREYSLECTQGIPEKSQYIEFASENKEIFNKDNVLSILESTSKKGKVQVTNYGGDVKVGNKLWDKSEIIPVIYNQEPQWKMNVLRGRDFNIPEISSNEKVAVVGKEIGKNLLDGDKGESAIYIGSEKLRVIGVIGREHRKTRWDYTVLIPLKSYFELNNYNKSGLSLFITSNKGNPKGLTSEIISSIQKIDPKVKFKEKENKIDGRDITITLGLTIIVSGAILFVTIINVMNLSVFKILRRQKEIGIRKALGASDLVIIKMIIKETVAQVILAAIIAFVLQIVIQSKIEGIIIEAELTFTWINFVFGFSLAIICGIISSILPARTALKIAPAEVIKIE